MTTFSPSTPTWARDLVVAVCSERGVEPPARVRWSRRHRVASSGVTRSGDCSISVVAGTDPVDQRLTLLHELAHWLLPVAARRRRRAPHHDRRFYQVAFGLYRSYGLTDADALSREASHYPSSLRHARALGIAGAEEAWRERLLALQRRRLARAPMRVLVPEHRVQLVRDGRWTVCAVCRQRIVGPNLARMRRRGGRHTLFIREAAS
ncbi:MAG TPA: hypothetical protein VFM74_08150 [Candidatus Limnocylindria bacterium]|nr:hypothetical protein [Candidatus Limnocylindria bacterium]